MKWFLCLKTSQVGGKCSLSKKVTSLLAQSVESALISVSRAMINRLSVSLCDNCEVQTDGFGWETRHVITLIIFQKTLNHKQVCRVSSHHHLWLV